MKFKYTVTGIDCPNCAAKLASNMEKLDGIESVKINFLTEKLIVESELEESALRGKLADEAKKFSRDIEIE